MPGAYWPQPWTCEDGGPLRRCCADGVPGLGIQPGERLEVAAVADAFATDVLVRRDPGELYALRHDMPLRRPLDTPVEGWVERLDPETLAVTASTPRLPGGTYWPGGMAAHANGDLHMVFGRWAHRLTPDLDVLASHRLPVPRPHNSFVVLDGGELVTKDCDAPAGLEPSTVSVLDPETLLPVAPPLRLPEPSIARLASDGESVIAVGTTVVYRLRLDRDAGRLEIDDAVAALLRPGARAQLRLGPGDHRRARPVDGQRAQPHRPHDARHGRRARPRAAVVGAARRRPRRCARSRSAACRSAPSPTRPRWDPSSGVVIAYDAGNAVLRAWRLVGDDLEPLWRRDGFAHAGHLILYPDTRELVVQDWKDLAALRRPLVRRTLAPALQVLAQSAAARRASLRTGSDQLVVLDLDTGEDKARVDVPSPSQGFLFPAPGFARDVYYQSLTTIARVAVVS